MPHLGHFTVLLLCLYWLPFMCSFDPTWSLMNKEILLFFFHNNLMPECCFCTLQQPTNNHSTRESPPSHFNTNIRPHASLIKSGWPGLVIRRLWPALIPFAWEQESKSGSASRRGTMLTNDQSVETPGGWGGSIGGSLFMVIKKKRRGFLSVDYSRF